MPRKFTGPKDQFTDLSEDFRSSVDAQSRDDIKRTICQVTLDQLELDDAQKEDEDYQSLKEQFREAGAVYREGAKTNKLKIPLWDHDSGTARRRHSTRRSCSISSSSPNTPPEQHLVYRHEGGFHIFHAQAGRGKIVLYKS